jgi:hypothetical protein
LLIDVTQGLTTGFEDTHAEFVSSSDSTSTLLFECIGRSIIANIVKCATLFRSSKIIASFTVLLTDDGFDECVVSSVGDVGSLEALWHFSFVTAS